MSSSSTSPFTLPYHLPPNQRDPTTAPRLPPLLNMTPVEQPTHTLCSKTAAEQQKHEPTTHHQGDKGWRAARGDMAASQTIGQTTTGQQPARQPGLCEPDERKRRDDVGWVDWVGW